MTTTTTDSGCIMLDQLKGVALTVKEEVNNSEPVVRFSCHNSWLMNRIDIYLGEIDNYMMMMEQKPLPPAPLLLLTPAAAAAAATATATATAPATATATATAKKCQNYIALYTGEKDNIWRVFHDTCA